MSGRMMGWKGMRSKILLFPQRREQSVMMGYMYDGIIFLRSPFPFPYSFLFLFLFLFLSLAQYSFFFELDYVARAGF